MSAPAARDSAKSIAAARSRAAGGATLGRRRAEGAHSAARHALWMFDFDNTLAPLEPAVDWAKSRRELQAWLALRGVAATLFEEFPRGNLVLYEALRARLCAGGDATRTVLARGEIAVAAGDADGPQAAGALRALLDGASAVIEHHELAGVRKLAPAPGAIELLRALRAAGSTVAMVSSNSSRTIAAWLKARHAVDLVDLIIGRDSGLALKPSPAMVERVLEACAAAPADAAFAGDSEADVNAAAAAGVRFYGVNAKPQGRDRLIALGASQVFSSPSALAIYLGLPIYGAGNE